jgi:cysteine synthase B
VAGIGTSGTFTGVTRFLKGEDPAVQCIAVEPDGPMHGLEGMKHMASAMVPPIWRPTLPDRRVAVPTEEAYAMCRRLAREEGIFVGPSSGANVAAALSLAREIEAPAVIVTILSDGGSRYLSHDFWSAP